jgi:hypothetical protein
VCLDPPSAFDRNAGNPIGFGFRIDHKIIVSWHVRIHFVCLKTLDEKVTEYKKFRTFGRESNVIALLWHRVDRTP